MEIKPIHVISFLYIIFLSFVVLFAYFKNEITIIERDLLRMEVILNMRGIVPDNFEIIK